MPELRLTVGMPGAPPEVEEKELDDLMGRLASEAMRHAQFSRAPGFGKADGPLRVFNAVFQGPEALQAVLRGTLGWYMRHPAATMTLRMESSKGGVTLQFKEYSPVEFAKATRRFEEFLE